MATDRARVHGGTDGEVADLAAWRERRARARAVAWLHARGLPAAALRRPRVAAGSWRGGRLVIRARAAAAVTAAGCSTAAARRRWARPTAATRRARGEPRRRPGQAAPGPRRPRIQGDRERGSVPRARGQAGQPVHRPGRQRRDREVPRQPSLRARRDPRSGRQYAADLFDEPHQASNGRGYEVTATYTYTDEAGDPAVLRRAPRAQDLRQYHVVNGQKVPNIEGVRCVLYQLPRVIGAVKNGDTIYVAEGEKDVHALEARRGSGDVQPDGRREVAPGVRRRARKATP